MERVVSIEEVRSILRRPRLEGRTIGLVPTMGALHAGHLSLVEASRQRCDLTVVSVFVNPTQFGEGEDFDSYPRDLDADAGLLEEAGVDVLFAPTVPVMYPPGATTRVDPGPIGQVLCGVSRPVHFAGVATVVTKLLGIVEPDVAFFGEKDYQQLRVVESVVRDLDIDTRIVGCPIVREPDGLALSSRNRYLSREDRARALVLSRALAHAQQAAAAGDTDAAALQAELAARIAAEPDVELEYAAIVDAKTLEPVTVLTREGRALVAARVGSARLIDNVAIRVPGAVTAPSGAGAGA
jgi:pantoate--beta-alanine ligase